MRSLFILLLAAMLGPAQQAAPQQQQQPIETETPLFKAGTAQVRIDTQVLENDQPVRDLTKADFIVYDENVRQEVAFIDQESEPLHLLLLLDISGSMQKFLEPVAQQSRRALRALKIEDKVAIMLFSKTTKVSREFTSDVSSVSAGLTEALHDQSMGFSTEINASVLDAIAYLNANTLGTTGRRAILIITDNQGMSYKMPDEAVIAELQKANTVMNAIVVGKGRRPEKLTLKKGQELNPDFTPADVYHLAEETGGEAIKAEDTGLTFTSMLERIRTRYSIQYKAPEGKPGQFRNVRVELTPEARKRHPKAVIRARKGYFAG